jgi:hypothetical protein
VIDFLKPFGRRPTPATEQPVTFGDLLRQARAGDVHAMVDLGNAYQDAIGGAPQDYSEAVTWYLKADAAGDDRASYLLAQMYEKGLGVRQDFEEALKRYRPAAARGFPSALCNLGAMYARGAGVDRNLIVAYTCFRLATMAGNVPATVNLGQMWQLMTAEQMAEGARLASAWRPGQPLPPTSELPGNQQERTDAVVLGLLRPLLKSVRELSRADMSVVELGFRQPGAALATVEGSPLWAFYRQLLEFGWVISKPAPPIPGTYMVETTGAGCNGVMMLFESIRRDLERAGLLKKK